jgi:hypothetical protein
LTFPAAAPSLAFADADAAASAFRVASRLSEDSAREESSREMRRSARVAVLGRSPADEEVEEEWELEVESERGERREDAVTAPWLSGLGRASLAALEEAEPEGEGVCEWGEDGEGEDLWMKVS